MQFIRRNIRKFAQIRQEVPRRSEGKWSLSKWKQAVYKQKGLVSCGKGLWDHFAQKKKCKSAAQIHSSSFSALLSSRWVCLDVNKFRSVFSRRYVSVLQNRQTQQTAPETLFPPSLPPSLPNSSFLKGMCNTET